MNDTMIVNIYYGPLHWLNDEIDKICGTLTTEGMTKKNLLDAIDERDNERRRIIHTTEENTDPEPLAEFSGPDLLIAESSDYASLQEHAITNFANLIRSLNPKHVILHNPPSRILTQFERSFSPIIDKYQYPKITGEALKNFDKNFSNHIIGQDHVKEPLLAAMYHLTNNRRTKPVVLMLYGPSGVGKTETAQFINNLLGGTLMRQQFSMFHNEKFASYLFGGKHSEGSFAHDLLDRDSGVILIDEFDKTNSVFHGAFYQFFDDGIFVDSNYSVEVGPTLIICTSNYETEEEIQRSLGYALYSRFDSFIRFTKLSREDSCKVIYKLIDDRYNSLDPKEQENLDIENIREKFLKNAYRLDNVRKLGKLIEEVFSTLLVRAFWLIRQMCNI